MTQSRRLDDYGDVLTLADVAVILGWHLETVRLWARQGKLPARKAERHYLVLKKDLVDWLEGLPRVDSRGRAALRGMDREAPGQSPEHG